VLYSINVFLTFSMSLLGMCVYWWRHRSSHAHWRHRFALSALGFSVTSSVLVITLSVKFTEGGWLTALVTSSVIGLCLLVRYHYRQTRNQLASIDTLYADEPVAHGDGNPPPLDPDARTAVLFVGRHRGVSMHALLWVIRLFPGQFRNFIFLGVGEVDSECFEGQQKLNALREALESSMRYYVAYCHRHGLAADYLISFGTNPLLDFEKLAEQAVNKYPSSVCFASKLIFANGDFLTKWLHNQTPIALQEQLHLNGRQMVLLPMRIG